METNPLNRLNRLVPLSPSSPFGTRFSAIEMMWRIDRFLYRKEKPRGLKTLLLPLSLFSFPYGWAVRLRALFYDLGFSAPQRLRCPVISVGNITVGGTGKTPLAIFLATRLRQEGIPVAVLTRGYKGKKVSGAVVSDGKDLFLSPEESGDEPYLMGKTLTGIPVLAGKDRFQNGQLALQRFGVQGVLLDDGYQHLPLYRDLNILLIDARIGFGDHTLLPRGILREPLSHLRRADLFLLTKMEHLEACKSLEEEIHRIHPTCPVFHSHYEATGLIGPDDEPEDLHFLKGKRVIALSGIANPDHFALLLRKQGADIVKELIFPDHHFYRSPDLTLIEKTMKEGNWVITTEKDMIKLKGLKINHLPIRALRIELKIWEEKELFKRVTDLFSTSERGKREGQEWQ